MYDGTTAAAEAVMMAVASGKKQNKVLVSETLDPKTLEVIRTYAHFHGIELQMIVAENGVTSKADMEAKLAEGGVAGVLVQQPNYYGIWYRGRLQRLCRQLSSAESSLHDGQRDCRSCRVENSR